MPYNSRFLPQDPYAPGANLPQSLTPDISEPVMIESDQPARQDFDWGTASAGGGIGGEVGDALGTLIGELFGAGADREQATKYMQEILGLYSGYDANEQVSTLGPSAFNGIRQDPNLRSQENATLAHLRGLVDSGGLDARAKANLDAVQRNNAEASFGQQRAIDARAARRGAAAPGLDILSAQVAAQGAADRNAASGLNIAADAEDRALQAAVGSGNMAGRMARDDWGRAADVAGANDAVSRFNAQNLQNIFERNLDREWRRRQGMAGAMGDLAQDRLNAASRWGRVGRGIGRGVGAGLGYAVGGGLGGMAGGGG